MEKTGLQTPREDPKNLRPNVQAQAYSQVVPGIRGIRLEAARDIIARLKRSGLGA